MPQVDREALEGLIREGDLRSSWPDLHADNDDAATDVVRKTSERLNELRHEARLNRWFFVAVWFAGGIAVAFWGHAHSPATWYEWPILLVAGVFLAGLPLIAVYGTTVFLHIWWDRYGGTVSRLVVRRKRARADV